MIEEYGARLNPRNKGPERWFGFYTDPDSGESVDLPTTFGTKDAALKAAEAAASTEE